MGCPKTKPAETPRVIEDFRQVPLKSQADLVEAAGFEPASRDTVNGGLYMFTRSFDLIAGDEERDPSPATSRLYLARNQRPSRRAIPLFSAGA